MKSEHRERTGFVLSLFILSTLYLVINLNLKVNKVLKPLKNVIKFEKAIFLEIVEEITIL